MTTKLGTDITCNITGRRAMSAPGWCSGPGSIASPPDAEVNIAPLETETKGVIIVDGSIPCDELGLLEEPLKLVVEQGCVVDIIGKHSEVLEAMFEKAGDSARVVAEVGIGLNRRAQLCGRMLEDEGCAGTVHFGMGSNSTIGGKNQISFHLDHIVKNAEIRVDGKKLAAIDA